MQEQGRTGWLAARTKIFGDVGAVIGLVELLEAGEVLVEGGSVTQLDTIGQHQEAARAQHARHFSRGRTPDSRRQLMEEVNACHLLTEAACIGEGPSLQLLCSNPSNPAFHFAEHDNCRLRVRALYCLSFQVQKWSCACLCKGIAAHDNAVHKIPHHGAARVVYRWQQQSERQHSSQTCAPRHRSCQAGRWLQQVPAGRRCRYRQHRQAPGRARACQPSTSCCAGPPVGSTATDPPAWCPCEDSCPAPAHNLLISIDKVTLKPTCHL